MRALDITPSIDAESLQVEFYDLLIGSVERLIEVSRQRLRALVKFKIRSVIPPCPERPRKEPLKPEEQLSVRHPLAQDAVSVALPKRCGGIRCRIIIVEEEGSAHICEPSEHLLTGCPELHPLAAPFAAHLTDQRQSLNTDLPTNVENRRQADCQRHQRAENGGDRLQPLPDAFGRGRRSAQIAHRTPRQGGVQGQDGHESRRGAGGEKRNPVDRAPLHGRQNRRVQRRLERRAA